ncbi:MAG: tetratricopeptide repeat protein [Spirochaetes bacterium]|nr:tetratricopeptide repeat protein [Spirochaetota bacterium]
MNTALYRVKRFTLVRRLTPLFAAFILLVDSYSLAAMDSRLLFDQGMEAFKTGNYGSAELLFRKIVDSPGDEYLDRAWFYLARSIFSKGKYDLALFEFKNFLNRCKTDALSAESRYWMGECYYNLSDKPNAIEEFRRYIAVAGDGELAQNAHDRIGMMYQSQKRYDEAIIEWEAARAKSSDQQRNHARQYWIGEALYRSGKYDEAIKKLSPLSAVLTDTRINAMADIVLGRIYQKKGDHQKALQMFASIPAGFLKEEQFIEAQYFKARSHMKLGQKAQAKTLLDAFLAAAAKDSRWYESARFELAGILIQGPDHEEGLKLMEEVRAGSTKDGLKSRAALMLGRYYAELSPDKAIPYLEESLKKAKQAKRKELLELIGKTAMRAHNYTRAIEYFNIYLKENPFDENRDEINFLKARAYLEMGEIDKATIIFETSRKENPFSKFAVESNYYMALVRYRQGQKSKAVAMLLEYISRKNGEQSYEAHVALMRIYLGDNDLERAGRVAEALVREYLGRKDVESVLYDYATALLKNGKDARRFVNLILNRFPGTESAAEMYMALGNENYEKSRFIAALEGFNNYLKSPYTKNRGNAFYKLLHTLYRLKRYDDVIALVKKGNFPSLSEQQWKEIPLIQARSYYALKTFEDVYMTLEVKNMKDYPKDDIVMYIRCALKAGDYRSAIEANEFLEKDKTYYSESLYIIADYMMRNENMDEAELFFFKIINECPGTSFVDQAKLALGEMLIMQRKYPEAINRLATVEDSADKNIQKRKNAMLIRCHCEMGMADMAATLTESNLQDLIGSEYGEQVFTCMARHYYKKKDLQHFDRYARHMARYPGNESELNYMAGKLNFFAGNYQNAYNHFLPLSRVKSNQGAEALYFIGLYNLMVTRNIAAAMNIFAKLIDMEDAADSVKRKALIQCAIMYREMNDNDKTLECLKKVLSIQHRSMTYIQAINLLDEFGFDGK